VRWHDPALPGRAERVRSARVIQTSTCSDMAGASSPIPICDPKGTFDLIKSRAGVWVFSLAVPLQSASLPGTRFDKTAPRLDQSVFGSVWLLTTKRYGTTFK
jgi:hypothetical protein